MATSKIQRIFIRIGKGFLWLLGGIFTLLLLVMIALQFNFVQNKLKNAFLPGLKDKLGTELALEELNIDFPTEIVLKGIYLEDTRQDTLFYAERLQVGINMLALVSTRVEITNILLKNAYGNIYQVRPDTSFNYQFIIDAFASDTTAQADTSSSSSSWEIAVYGAELQNVRIVYDAATSGSRLKTSIGAFEVEMDEFNLQEMIYRVDEASLANSSGMFELFPAAVPVEDGTSNTTDSTLLPEIGVGALSISNTNFVFNDSISELFLEVASGELSATAEAFSLNKQLVALESFTSVNTGVFLYTEADTASTSQQPEGSNAATTAGDPVFSPWRVSANEIDIEQFNFHFNNPLYPQTPGTVNFNHLQFPYINIKVNDLLAGSHELTADLQSLSLKEQSGFQVNRGEFSLRVDRGSASLQNLELVTPHSRFESSLQMDYTSLERVMESPGEATLEAIFSPWKIGYRDVAFFVENLDQQVPGAISQNQDLLLRGELQGTVDNFSINNFYGQTFRRTYLRMSGQVQNVTRPDDLLANIRLDTFHTTRDDLVKVLPDTLLPQNIQLPQTMGLSGAFEGSTTDFNVQANLGTSLGSVVADARVQNTDSLRYSGSLGVSSLQAGTLLSDTTLGQVSVATSFRGTGTSPESMALELQAQVQEAVYQNYDYGGVELAINYDRGAIDGMIDSKNPNLEVLLDGRMDLSDTVGRYQANMQIKNIHLGKLNLTSEPFVVSGNVQAVVSTSNANDLNAKVEIEQFTARNGEDSYSIDTLGLVVDQQPDSLRVQLQSSIADALLTGNVNLGNLGPQFITFINQRMPLLPEVPEDSLPLPPSELTWNFQLKDTALVTGLLVPSLNSIAPFTLEGQFSDRDSLLSARLKVPFMNFSGIQMDSVSLDVETADDGDIVASAGAGLVTGPVFKLWNPSVEASLGENRLDASLAMQDSLGDQLLRLAGVLRQQQDSLLRFTIDTSAVVLGGEAWQVPEDNYVQFGGPNLIVNNLNLQNGEQSIKINSQGGTGSRGENMLIAFNQLDLAYFADLAAGDEQLLLGILDGQLQLENMADNLSFEAEMDIENFGVYGDTIADIGLTSSQTGNNRYSFELTMTDNGHNVLVDGFYIADSAANELNLTADIGNINLSALQGLTLGQVEEMGGALKGQLQINGTTAQPAITGDLSFVQATIVPAMLGTPLNIDQETISFTSQGIEFNDFTIRDARQNPATLNGLVRTEDFTTFNMDLSVESEKFMAIDSEEQEEVLYYGTGIVSTDMQISGTVTSPEITGNLTVNEDTDLKYILPEDQVALEEREGIVEFVNMTDTAGLVTLPDEDTVNTTGGLTGILLNLNIDINEQAQFAVIIDPVTGDRLEVTGGGNLSYALQPSGEMTLSGRYEVQDGRYVLNFYEIVKRTFSIRKGSTILWTGDPLDARLDITAMYDAETSPTPLLPAEGAEEDPLEFMVMLYIQEDLNSPDISFGLDMPVADRDALSGRVYQRLQQLNNNEAELNKQVFALLVLNSFISDSPLGGSGGGGEGLLASTARSSVSSLLTNQLNQLTDRYISGVSLDLGLESYEDGSGGDLGRTELELQLSKQFFNDRVEVQVGGNVNLTGGEQQSRNASNLAGNVTILYDITEDGRYRLKVYRQDEYEALIEGDYISTGVSVIFTRDYNNLRELFKSNNEEEKQKQDQQQREETADKKNGKKKSDQGK